MNRLNDIKVHDLMEIRADEGEEACDIAPGLYIALAIIDMPIGPLIEVSMVGGGRRGVNISKRNENLVKRVVHISGIPAALEALEAVDRTIQLAAVCNEGTDALYEWIEASDDATTKVLAALRALRGDPA